MLTVIYYSARKCVTHYNLDNFESLKKISKLVKIYQVGNCIHIIGNHLHQLLQVLLHHHRYMIINNRKQVSLDLCHMELALQNLKYLQFLGKFVLLGHQRVFLLFLRLLYNGHKLVY